MLQNADFLLPVYQKAQGKILLCAAAAGTQTIPRRTQEEAGLAGAEASAHGKPVVAFEVGGVREWLDDGVTGFAVPEKEPAAEPD